MEIDEIFVVTNNVHLKAFQRWADNSSFLKKVHIVPDGTSAHHERKGAVGDLHFLVQRKEISTDLLIIAGDNFFEFQLSDFVAHFHKHGGPIVALHDLGDPGLLAGRFGVATLDPGTQRITEFSEKPATPASAIASTLCYILTPAELRLLAGFVTSNPTAGETGVFLAHLIKRRSLSTAIRSRSDGSISATLTITRAESD